MSCGHTCDKRRPRGTPAPGRIGAWPWLGPHWAGSGCVAPGTQDRARSSSAASLARRLRCQGNWARRAFRRRRGALQRSWRRPSGTPTPGRLCIAPGTPCATCASGSRIAPEPRAFLLSAYSSLNLTSQRSAAPTFAYSPDHCLRGLPASPLIAGTLSTHSFQAPRLLGALCPQYTLPSHSPRRTRRPAHHLSFAGTRRTFVGPPHPLLSCVSPSLLRVHLLVCLLTSIWASLFLTESTCKESHQATSSITSPLPRMGRTS